MPCGRPSTLATIHNALSMKQEEPSDLRGSTSFRRYTLNFFASISFSAATSQQVSYTFRSLPTTIHTSLSCNPSPLSFILSCWIQMQTSVTCEPERSTPPLALCPPFFDSHPSCPGKIFARSRIFSRVPFASGPIGDRLSMPQYGQDRVS